MNYDVEIHKIWDTLNSLQAAFIQSQRNQVPITGKVDETSNRVDTLTPYTETKQAYIGDTEISFFDVPDGNLSVFFRDEQGNYPDYTIERVSNTITICFDELQEVTTITITIQ